MTEYIEYIIAGIAGVSFYLGRFLSSENYFKKLWLREKEWGEDILDEWEEDSKRYGRLLADRDTIIHSQGVELEACWKCINARSNKGHWQKQKRVNGKFAK